MIKTTHNLNRSSNPPNPPSPSPFLPEPDPDSLMLSTIFSLVTLATTPSTPGESLSRALDVVELDFLDEDGAGSRRAGSPVL